MVQPNECPGCNCWNETEPLDISGLGDDYYAPCCDGEPSPCAYVVLFQCDHDWPALRSDGDLMGLPAAAGDAKGVFKWFYQVHRLGKECGNSCLYSETHKLSETILNNDWECSKMIPCGERVRFANEQHTFPQYNYPPLEAIKACYQSRISTGDIVCIASCDHPSEGPVSEETEVEYYRFWELDISAGTLTWNFTGVPGRGNPIALFASLGKSPPLYEADNAWDRWDRNSMTLSNANEWPSLPSHICVKAHNVGIPKVCDTNADQCNCCDNGEDTAIFGVSLSTECARLEGCNAIASTRVRDAVAFEATYPGASYPGSAPCGVWPFTVGDGDGCVSESVSWGGSVLIVVYCTGSTYAGDVYCFNAELEEWVFQGNLDVTDFRCLDNCERFTCAGNEYVICCTWVIAATLPEIDCCCPEGVETDCGTIPTVITVSDGMGGTITLTYDPVDMIWESPVGAGDIAGCTGKSYSLSCAAGPALYFSIDPDGISCGPSGTFEPLDQTCILTGCDSNVYTLTFTE